jgi:hypothetical protein
MTGAEMENTVVCLWGLFYVLFKIVLSFLGVLNSFETAAILNILSEFDNIVGGMSHICFRSVLYFCIQLSFPFFYCIYFGALLISKRDLDVIIKVVIYVDIIMTICFNITQTNLMLLLKQRFKILNFRLLELIHDSRNRNTETVHQKPNSKREKVSSKILPLTAIRNFRSQLFTVIAQHGRLCDASNHFSFFYSVQTLLCVTISFIELTVNAYVAFLNIMGLESGFPERNWTNHMTVLETYCHVTNVWAIAWSGCSAAQQVRESLKKT